MLIFATLLLVVYLVFLLTANQEDLSAVAYNKILDNRGRITMLTRKACEREKQLSKKNGLGAVFVRLRYGNCQQKIARYQGLESKISSGNLRSVAIFEIPGYCICRRFHILQSVALRRNLMSLCGEYYGGAHALEKSKQIVAQVAVYSLVGSILSLAIGSVVISLGFGMVEGLFVVIVGITLSILLGFSFRSALLGKVKARRHAITRDFPNVASKLALLVSSGSIMNTAWKEVAFGDSGVLYEEMQTVSKELENMKNPLDVYKDFILRCNVKEVSKLASAVIQNQAKGNAELANVLRDTSSEAWSLRKNLAKRDAELANSKLLIPMMLLFGDILLLILVPMLTQM